jgi:hypothetical protein
MHISVVASFLLLIQYLKLAQLQQTSGEHTNVKIKLNI